MKTPLGSPVNCGGRRAAFTLIELLTVMAIILVLAGLIINVAGSAHYNSAKSRAQGEIKAFETALENYKTDNGAYPQDPNTPTDQTQAPPTTMLDARNYANSSDNTDPTSLRYKTNSELLYQALSGFPIKVSGAASAPSPSPDPNSTPSMSKSYYKFTPGQLQIATFEPGAPTAVTTNSPNMYIVDPFGFSYGYSTIYAATQAYNNAQASASTATVKVGYNPTFDLWSTAGYAPSGKSLPTPPANMSNADFYSSLWIKNW